MAPCWLLRSSRACSLTLLMRPMVHMPDGNREIGATCALGTHLVVYLLAAARATSAFTEQGKAGCHTSLKDFKENLVPVF